MSLEPQGNPRTGKYCPRCHTMTLRDKAVCPHCGHHFRTSADGTASETNSPEPDSLNRTMQFTLPPLALRPAAPPLIEPLAFFAGNSRRTVIAALLVGLLFCASLAAWLWQGRRSPVLEAVSPVGVWETTLHGKASSDAHLEFAFQADGNGLFIWRESGQKPLSGQTPLHWTQNADGTLTLTLSKPVSTDPVSETLVTIFGSHHWPWHVDSDGHRLVLGTLVFTEKS